MPFTGPRAQVAEATVVRTLRKKALLIPHSRWQASAKKLFAPSHSPEDISSVAEDVGARVVITGVVKRDGRAWQLVVSVRDGKSGRSRDKLKYPLKAPRIEPRTLSLLAQEVDTAFDHALAAGDGGEEEEAPAKPVAKAQPKVAPIDETDEPPPAPRPRKKSESAQSEPPAEEAKTDAEAEPATPRPEPAIKRAAPPHGRPRWAPYFDLVVGASVTGRSFDFTPSSLPRFATGIAGGLHVDLTLYPFAFSHASLSGVFAGLGLGATVDKPFWHDSKTNDGNQYATAELRVEGGLRWRFVLYKPVPRPELILSVGGGLHQFAIAKKIDPVTMDQVDVGPPDVKYTYTTFGATVRLHFAEWARIWASFAYHYVLSAGPATSLDEYGPASTYGIRVAGGLDFFVYKGLKISLEGHYERLQLSFLGGNPLPAKPGNGEIAQNGVDQYFGGVVSLGYEF